MSLINEALKKAQRMRSQEPPSSTPVGQGTPATGPAPVIIRRGRPMGAQTLVLAVSVGAILVVASVIVTFLLMRSDGDPVPVAQQSPSTPAVSAPATIAPVPQIRVDLPIGPTLATTATEPRPIPTPSPAPSSPVPAAPTPKAPTNAPAAAAPAPVAPAPPAAPPQPNLRVYAFLDGLRVNGIRASATDPRVFMNDRIFRINDIVDRDLGLRITAIDTTGLKFEDEAGVSYTKTF